MSEKTLFSRIIDREIPSEIIYEDEHCIAFRDISPQAPLHALVVPRKPIPKVADAAAADAGLLGQLLLAAGKVAEQQGYADAYRLVINNGSGAGQTVFHLHVHVLGGRAFKWPPG
ncbi:MAG: HIT domain-containing protein [Gammaproteobacteria bacterium]|nr:HIT domain-containing protein [Gammaproteobacteria bacterium]MBI5618971.1 HIT domain-containing protein [Gammaproteobacteria bacterium]